MPKTIFCTVADSSPSYRAALFEAMKFFLPEKVFTMATSSQIEIQQQLYLQRKVWEDEQAEKLRASKQNQTLFEASLAGDVTLAKPHREQLLQQAIAITNGDRNKAYGSPEDNFANIAAYWNSYLTQAHKADIVLTPQDVAHLMILMKMARLATNPAHYDSLLDIAGYAACAADCQQK